MKAATDLLRARTRVVYVEMTSRCNLRCVYCAVSQPDYVGSDLGVDPDQLVHQIAALEPREVQISGHGETTMLKGWQELAQSLLRRGLPLSIITNLARPHSPAEVEVLSRFFKITVSCDTSDPALFARLRRGGRLEVVEANLKQLIAHCRAQGREPPFIALNCTFSDVTVEGLVELVHYAARLGLSGVSLTNLVPYPEIAAFVHVRHPAEVDPVRAWEQVRAAQSVAKKLGLEFEMMDGLHEVLEGAARR